MSKRQEAKSSSTYTLLKPACLDKAGYLSVPLILQLSRDLRKQTAPISVCNTFLHFLQKIIGSNAIAIVTRQANDKKLHIVSEGNTNMPQTIPTGSSRYIDSILNSTQWAISIGQHKDIQAGESSNLFLPSCQQVFAFPMLSSEATALGIVKIDSKKTAHCSDSCRASLELVSNLVATRLDDVEERERLLQSKIDRWFDATQLAFKGWKDTEDIMQTLKSQLDQLISIDSNLEIKWRFYIKGVTPELYYLDKKRNVFQFVADPHYRGGSHIKHFFENHKQKYIYDNDEVRKTYVI